MGTADDETGWDEDWDDSNPPEARSTNRRLPLPSSELRAMPKLYEVWITVDSELADQLRRTPLFANSAKGARSFKFSAHRVGPKRLFGLPRDSFPTEYQRERADDESLRCAQLQAHQLLQVKGVRLAVITWVLRKEASSRFHPGQKLSGCVGRLRSPSDYVIEGEPSPEALAIDQGRE